MFGQVKRTVVSFVAVMALFGVYRLVAEPLIEPPRVEKRVVAAPAEQQQQPAENQHRLGAYEQLFPEGSWQRDNPIMLESDSAKLLTKDYTNEPGGRVLLKPCTVIFFPDGNAKPNDNHRRVVVLQAPQATLQFDGPLDLNPGKKMSSMQGGILEGEIVVTSAATRPEGGDDIYAVTHDMQLIGNRMITSRLEDGKWVPSPNDVQFRFGPNQGHGRGMQIDLIPAADGKPRTFNFSGARNIQLLYDVEMHLQRNTAANSLNASQNDLAAGRKGRTNPLPGPGMGSGDAPVEIRCQGPFDFDVVGNIATFHKQVDVLRPNPNGSSDQINCETLSVIFVPRETSATESASMGDSKSTPVKPSGGRQQLEARKIDARGNPVVLRTPSSGGEVRGEHLLYDVVTGNMLMESPTSNVRIDSPQLHGQVSRWEALFRDDTQATAAAALTDVSSGQAPASNSPFNPAGNGANRHAAAQGGATEAPQYYEINAATLKTSFVTSAGVSKLEQVEADGHVWFAQSPPSPEEKRPLEIRGDQLQVFHADTQAQVTVVGQPAQVLAQGMTMFGQSIHMDQATNRLWIDGAGRMILEDTNPPADPAANAASSGAPMGLLSGSGPTVVDWQGNMKFDGLVARFERGIVGTQGTQSLHSELLEATMHDRIDFSAGRPQQRPQLELASCPGEAVLENHEFKDGAPTVVDWMLLHDLKVNRISGDLSAPGPGRTKSWRLGPPPNLSQIPGQPAAVSANTPQQTAAVIGNSGAAAVAGLADAKEKTQQINFVDVQYQNGLTGNALRREFTFHEQVRTVSGPVATWDGQLDADNPPAGAMLLTCNQLTLYEVGPRVEGRSPLNMKAEGNAQIEGQRLEGDLFRAWANELNYAQEKDLIMLKGDGRTDAQLYRQVRAGAPLTKTVARTILYWPSTRRVEVNDVHYLDFSQFGPPPPATPPHKK